MKWFHTLCVFLLFGCTSSPPKRSIPAARILVVAATPGPVVTRTLTWDANLPEENITSYNIYEVIPKTGTVPAHWQRTGTVTDPGFNFSGQTGTWRVFAVTAVNAIRESPFSNLLVYRVN